MKILIACEYSGRVRDAFAALGHDAMSCDLLPTEAPGNHYQGDVRDVLSEQWDLLIAHPECTYLTNAGVCHLHTDPKRWPKLFDAAEFFKLFLNADHIPMRAIENPIMHKYAKTLIGGGETEPGCSALDVWTHGAESYLFVVERFRATKANKYRQGEDDAFTKKSA